MDYDGALVPTARQRVENQRFANDERYIMETIPECFPNHRRQAFPEKSQISPRGFAHSTTKTWRGSQGSRGNGCD